MNFLRMASASVAAFLAYFVVGGLIFGLVPSLKSEFLKYPAVYRTQQGQMRFMPLGAAAMFIAIVALAALYAMLSHDGSGLANGARFGLAYRDILRRSLRRPQLRQSEHRPQTYRPASRRLLFGVAYRRHRDRRRLSTVDALKQAPAVPN